MSINHVFAENLKALMALKGFNQPKVAELADVSQKTVSNCLNPSNRDVSASGVEKSATLTNVGKISRALGSEPWQMLRPLDPKKRAAIDRIEEVLKALQAPIDTPPEPTAPSVVQKLPARKSAIQMKKRTAPATKARVLRTA